MRMQLAHDLAQVRESENKIKVKRYDNKELKYRLETRSKEEQDNGVKPWTFGSSLASARQLLFLP